MNNITVIVPIYKDWETLKICIDSLKSCIHEYNKVYFVNDMGPEWKNIQQKVLELIDGIPNFYYFKNDFNMGFVKTCNRAVKELDKSNNDILLLNSDTKVTKGAIEEMKNVLYIAEKHGVVCPRSNNATLLSVPVKNNLGFSLSPAESWDIYCNIKDILPQYSIIPTGVGYAMLIKRKLINEFGLFDEIYGRGYNEENDFCMRVNQYGYNTIMANHAFIFHYATKSFGKERAELEQRNREILVKRYPFYSISVEQYFSKNIEPIDFFADLLCDGIYAKKRVLISLYEIPTKYNGTAEYGLSFLEEFYKLYGEVYDIHILINEISDKIFHISEKYLNVWFTNTIEGQAFHIAFIPSQIFHIEHLFILNKTCLKYVFCMQDIISLRSNYILAYDQIRQDVFRKAIHYCDGMVTISHFSLMDTIKYFPEEFTLRNIPNAIIYHGIRVKGKKQFRKNYERIFDKYFFVFGNRFKHKYLSETLDVLKESPYNFIFIGAEKEGYIGFNIYGYMSGRLEEDFIDYLIEKSQGILFPSLYEGFGLPILKGIELDKKVVINNNELNRELQTYFDSYSENMLLFEECKEINALLDQIVANPEVHYKDDKKIVRTWKEVAVDSEIFIRKILEHDINIELLRARWIEMCQLESILKMNARKNYSTKQVKLIIKKRMPKVYDFLKKIKMNMSK